ncbi:MAG: spore coat associated protein CotJA [Eubacteriales bacterium]
MNQTRYISDQRNRDATCRKKYGDHEGNPCDNQTPGCYSLSGHAYAMAYIPMQRFENLYTPEAGLCAGTLFRDLDLPFCGESISESAYPMAPARTCRCTDDSAGTRSRCCGMSRDKDSERGANCPMRRCAMRGGNGHD